MYGIQLWGCTSKTNVNSVQICQNKILRTLVNAPWYVRNKNIHRDLGIPTVADEIRRAAEKHEAKLRQHTNVEVLQFLDTYGLKRRLKRTKPFELV